MHHHTTDKDHFDLLPFIAILMCMLGCLLLVTMSMAAVSMGPAAGEGWIPAKDAQQASKSPVLIEWDGTNLVVHRESGRDEIQWTPPKTVEISGRTFVLKPEKGEGNPAFTALLAELEGKKSTHYALLAVRPSGFGQFGLASAEFRSRGIDIGYEPIGQAKPVRLLSGHRTNDQGRPNP